MQAKSLKKGYVSLVWHLHIVSSWPR